MLYMQSISKSSGLNLQNIPESAHFLWSLQPPSWTEPLSPLACSRQPSPGELVTCFLLSFLGTAARVILLEAEVRSCHSAPNRPWPFLLIKVKPTVLTGPVYSGLPSPLRPHLPSCFSSPCLKTFGLLHTSHRADHLGAVSDGSHQLHHGRCPGASTISQWLSRHGDTCVYPLSTHLSSVD